MRVQNPFVSSKRANAKAAATALDGVPISSMQQQYTTPGVLMRSSYDNGFAPISAISDEILKRNLHLGDVANPDTDVTTRFSFWNAFSRPNDKMGFMQFMDVLVAGFLSLPEISLLVYHIGTNEEGDPAAIPGKPEGEPFTLDNIAGFTIIPNSCKGWNAENREEWEVDFGPLNGGIQKFCSDDVITLKYSLLPDDGVTGVSPGSASAQEAAIRDRLNQFQRALFDNGATPSIIVTIHARTHEEAEAIQKAYEQRNRGAAKSGGVVYQTVIDNPIAGLGGEPHIEITVVGTPNNNLAISEIVEFTNTTIVSNYGVSPINYGDATTTTFQNQNLADSKFMDRVQAILVRLCGAFENELERILNIYLPFTFVWDDAALEVAEEQLIKAQVATETVRAFVGLVQSGVTPKQAQVMLALPEEWALVDILPPATTPDLVPSQPSLNQFQALKPLALEEGCTCPEHQHNKALPTKISEQEQTAQKKILNLLKQLAQDIFDKQVTNKTSKIKKADQEIIDELTQVMQLGADKTGGQLINDIDIDRSLADFSALSETSLKRLESRASKVITNYTDFVSDRLNSLDKDDPVRQTFEKFYTEHGRNKAKIIAQQETKNAYQNGELDVSKNIDRWVRKNKPQSYIVKTWTTTSDAPCRFCKRMNGTEAGIKDSFVPGGLINSGSEDVPDLVLDSGYSDGTIPDAHVNCQCVFKFSLKSK